MDSILMLLIMQSHSLVKRLSQVFVIWYFLAMIISCNEYYVWLFSENIGSVFWRCAIRTRVCTASHTPICGHSWMVWSSRKRTCWIPWHPSSFQIGYVTRSTSHQSRSPTGSLATRLLLLSLYHRQRFLLLQWLEQDRRGCPAGYLRPGGCLQAWHQLQQQHCSLPAINHHHHNNRYAAEVFALKYIIKLGIFRFNVSAWI